MEVLANVMGVILLQYINVAYQHIEHLKLTQCYINYISIKRNEMQKKMFSIE